MDTVPARATHTATDIICLGERSPGITVPETPDPNSRVLLASGTHGIPPS
jgi:hypothetical protein